MIRQPAFISIDFFNEMLEHTKKKKPQRLLERIQFIKKFIYLILERLLKRS